jgi:hypothetical protein
MSSRSTESESKPATTNVGAERGPACPQTTVYPGVVELIGFGTDVKESVLWGSLEKLF